jgi:hypothetical protein
VVNDANSEDITLEGKPGLEAKRQADAKQITKSAVTGLDAPRS